MEVGKVKRLDFIHFNDCYELESAPRFFAELLAHGWENKLRLFSGDFFFPSLLSLTFRGKPTEKFFELLAIDYATIGNHEVDEGVELFEELIRPHPTKWVLCNYKNTQNGTNLANASEYEIFERGGFQIGIFGILDPFWIEAAVNLDGYQYNDFKPRIIEVSQILKDKGCDLIICLTHMATISDEESLELNSHVDIFLGGHEHVYFLKQSNGKLALKSGSDYEMFSDVSLTLDSEPLSEANSDGFSFKLRRNKPDAAQNFAFSLPRNGKFLNVKISRVNVTKEGPVYQPFLDYYIEENAKLTAKLKVPAILLTTGQSLASSHMRKKENGFANLVTDITRIGLEVQISVHNAGALRSSRELPNNGSITLMDIRELEPYLSPFHIFELTGEAIVTLLNQSYSALPGEHGRFLHVSGIKVKLYPGRDSIVMPEDVTFRGSPINLKKLYKVSTPDFISGGRDGLTILEEFTNRIVEGSLSLYDILLHFVGLPERSKNRQEFTLFKDSLPNITDIELESLIPNAHSRSGLLKSLVDIGKETVSREDLTQLSAACLRRLRLYLLAESIEEHEGVFLFRVAGATEGRLVKLSDA